MLSRDMAKRIRQMAGRVNIAPMDAAFLLQVATRLEGRDGQGPPRVVIESPYGSSDPKIVARNERYAERCMLDSLLKGESPYLSHLLYTRVLDDRDPVQRRQGIEAGLVWGDTALFRITYDDYGVTDGMRIGIERGRRLGQRLATRSIGLNP